MSPGKRSDTEKDSNTAGQPSEPDWERQIEAFAAPVSADAMSAPAEAGRPVEGDESPECFS